MTEPASSAALAEIACEVCGNADGNRTIESREMMFGTRETFTYVECQRCGCLRLASAPDDLARYYGETYYSIRRDFRAWIRRHQTAYRLAHLVMVRRWPGLPDWWPKTHTDRSQAVLDVGCGAGNLLLRLQSLGFTNLVGIEPFIPADITYKGGITIHRQTLSKSEGQFDVVVMNHSFEHMPDPKGVFQDVKRLLAKDGVAVIRTPVASSWAWHEYAADWVQLDPPRHLFVHSEKSIRNLADATGLSLDAVVYDSTAMQFWGSEQYRRDIPFTDPRSYLNSPKASVFSRSEVQEFDRRAEHLNLRGEGDQACFYLHASARVEGVPS